MRKEIRNKDTHQKDMVAKVINKKMKIKIKMKNKMQMQSLKDFQSMVKILTVKEAYPD